MEFDFNKAIIVKDDSVVILLETMAGKGTEVGSRLEEIKQIIDLSNVARKEGLLSLEEAAGDLDDEFMKKGILLIVDGTDPEFVRRILEDLYQIRCFAASVSCPGQRGGTEYYR